MNPTQHLSNNGVLGAPPDWDQQGPHGYCQAVPVTHGQTQEGERVVLTFWRPSAEELAVLQRGGLVMLCVYGGTMPPVWIDARDADAPL